MSYQRLILEHDAIDAAAARLETALIMVAPDFIAVSEILSELALLVHNHLQDEDRSVYSPLVRLQQMHKLEADLEFESLFLTLREDWLEYLSEWTLDCVYADWDGFTSESSAMMTRLRERVAMETNLIYPLAMQQGAIRLREPLRMPRSN